MKRKLWKEDDKIIVESNNDIEMKDDKGQVSGTQITSVRQEWNLDKFAELQKQVLDQKTQTEDKITQMEKELKDLPRFSDREKQNLVKFKENFEKVQSLQKKEQLDTNIAAHKDGLKKMITDLEELDSVKLN